MNGITGNLIKNNIVTGNTSRALTVENGSENDGKNGGGNVYIYNILGAESTSFIEWGSGVYKSTYSGWETAYGGSTHSGQADPIFVSTSVPDFHLQPSSPAINAGTNVGLTSDYEGTYVPFGPAPDIGAYEYHSESMTLNPPKNLVIVP